MLSILRVHLIDSKSFMVQHSGGEADFEYKARCEVHQRSARTSGLEFLARAVRRFSPNIGRSDPYPPSPRRPPQANRVTAADVSPPCFSGKGILSPPVLRSEVW